MYSNIVSESYRISALGPFGESTMKEITWWYVAGAMATTKSMAMMTVPAHLVYNDRAIISRCYSLFIGTLHHLEQRRSAYDALLNHLLRLMIYWPLMLYSCFYCIIMMKSTPASCCRPLASSPSYTARCRVGYIRYIIQDIYYTSDIT